MVFAEDQSVKQAKSAPEAAPEVEPEPETAFQFFGKGADENEPQAILRKNKTGFSLLLQRGWLCAGLFCCLQIRMVLLGKIEEADRAPKRKGNI